MWKRTLTATTLGHLDNRLEQFRSELIWRMTGKEVDTREIAILINEILSISCMPETFWMKVD